MPAAVNLGSNQRVVFIGVVRGDGFCPKLGIQLYFAGYEVPVVPERRYRRKMSWDCRLCRGGRCFVYGAALQDRRAVHIVTGSNSRVTASSGFQNMPGPGRYLRSRGIACIRGSDGQRGNPLRPALIV